MYRPRISRLAAGMPLLILFMACPPAMGAPEKVGPALDAAMVALAVPPTRPGHPYAATVKRVFRLDPDASTWRPVFDLPPTATRIMGIAGYAQSSKVLYVVHEGGVARTGDGGGSWTTALPPGFRSDGIVAIRVSPADRKHAVLLTRDRAWRSRDYGLTWETFTIPGAEGAFRGAAFSQGDTPWLTVLAGRGVYHSPDLGDHWVCSARDVDGPGRLAASRGLLALPVAGGTPKVRLYDLSSTVRYRDLDLALRGEPGAVALDDGDRGALWFALGGAVFLLNLQVDGAEPELLFQGDGELRNLTACPKLPETLLWTREGQLWKLDNAFGARAEALLKPFPTVGFTVLRGAGDSVPDPGNVAAMLVKLRATEPSLRRTVAAALRYADYHPGEVQKWRRNARRRNFMPTLSLKAGNRDYPVSRWTSVTNTDRFGIDSIDDIHQSDRIERLDTFGVELEWNLRELLFDKDQVKISEEARRRAEQRNQLIREVTKLYYTRLDLKAEMELGRDRLDLKERLNLELRLLEATDMLNEICGNYVHFGEAREEDATPR